MLCNKLKVDVNCSHVLPILLILQLQIWQASFLGQQITKTASSVQTHQLSLLTCFRTGKKACKNEEVFETAKFLKRKTNPQIKVDDALARYLESGVQLSCTAIHRRCPSSFLVGPLLYMYIAMHLFGISHQPPHVPNKAVYASRGWNLRRKYLRISHPMCSTVLCFKDFLIIPTNQAERFCFCSSQFFHAHTLIEWVVCGKKWHLRLSWNSF